MRGKRRRKGAGNPAPPGGEPLAKTELLAWMSQMQRTDQIFNNTWIAFVRAMEQSDIDPRLHSITVLAAFQEAWFRDQAAALLAINPVWGSPLVLSSPAGPSGPLANGQDESVDAGQLFHRMGGETAWRTLGGLRHPHTADGLICLRAALLRLERVLLALPPLMRESSRDAWDLTFCGRRLGDLEAALRRRQPDQTPARLRRAATLVTEEDLVAFCHEHGLDSEPPSGSDSSQPGDVDDSPSG